VFLERGSKRTSTLDLFGTSFVCIAAPDGEAWHAAARQTATNTRAPLDVYRLGADELEDPEAGFADAYGISATGAVLIRPDGIVGWRAPDAQGASRQAFGGILDSLLCRPAGGGAASSAG
jgi:putative polyketide hydroxylase